MRELVSGLGWRIAPALLIVALGCATQPPIASFTLLAREPGVLRPEVLERGVVGEYCFSKNVVSATLQPPWQARLADTARAVAAALAKVPEANVLTSVSVQARVEQYLLFQRVCAIVVGDAGRIR